MSYFKSSVSLVTLSLFPLALALLRTAKAAAFHFIFRTNTHFRAAF